MKKVVFLAMMCLMALTMNAQKCVVLDFQLGTNVTAEETDAISYNFRTNFYPENFNVLEIERVNNVIKELGYDKTGMSKQQLLQVGRKLEAKIMVVGTLNKLMDEYSVDVQVIDVSTGTTIASEGNTFQKANYRREIKYIAQSLVHKVELKF
ncbi:MAG: hypothetical protein J6X59_04225 [Bacteroidales bacterium]|nr:hypothetical protein [Bacteroidales bacterium]